jgi:hypothetical protein
MPSRAVVLALRSPGRSALAASLLACVIACGAGCRHYAGDPPGWFRTEPPLELPLFGSPDPRLPGEMERLGKGVAILRKAEIPNGPVLNLGSMTIYVPARDYDRAKELIERAGLEATDIPAK